MQRLWYLFHLLRKCQSYMTNKRSHPFTTTSSKGREIWTTVHYVSACLSNNTLSQYNSSGFLYKVDISLSNKKAQKTMESIISVLATLKFPVVNQLFHRQLNVTQAFVMTTLKGPCHGHFHWSTEIFQTHIGFAYSISVKYVYSAVFTLSTKRLVGALAHPHQSYNGVGTAVYFIR